MRASILPSHTKCSSHSSQQIQLEEKSCATEEKVEIKRHDINKLNIFIAVKFPDIANNLGLKYKYPAAL